MSTCTFAGVDGKLPLVRVMDGVTVNVGVTVGVIVIVGVMDGVTVNVGVIVGVGVAVGLAFNDGVIEGVIVGVGVELGAAKLTIPPMLTTHPFTIATFIYDIHAMMAPAATDGFVIAIAAIVQISAIDIEAVAE